MSLITPHLIRQLRKKLYPKAKREFDSRFGAARVTCVRLRRIPSESRMQQICTSGSMSGERKRMRWFGLRHRRVAKAAGHS